MPPHYKHHKRQPHTVKMKPILEGDMHIHAEDIHDAARQVKELVKKAYLQYLQNCDDYRENHIMKLAQEMTKKEERRFVNLGKLTDRLQLFNKPQIASNGA
jgi:hypothetical protein